MKKTAADLLKRSTGIVLSIGLVVFSSASAFAATVLSPIYDVPVDKAWTVSFSKDVDPYTVSDNVVVTDQAGSEIRTELSIEGEKVNINPIDSVKYGQEYSILVKSSLKSVEGEYLSNEVQKSFTTVSYDELKMDMVTTGGEVLPEDVNTDLKAVQYSTYNAAQTYQEAALITAKVLEVDPAKVSYETWSEAVSCALGLWNKVDMESAQLEIECDALIQKAQPYEVSAQRVVASAYDKDEITAVFDAAPAGRKIKTLANHLGVDARRAFAMLKMSQEELKAEAWNNEGDTMEVLENTATVIKDGSKVALFVGGAIITGGVASGGMTISQAGAAVTAAGKAGLAQIVRQGGATLVMSGVDLALEVSADSAGIAFGKGNGFTAMVTEVRSVTAPAAGVMGFYNVKNTSSAADWVCNTFMVADMEREAFQEGKLFGIKVTDESVFAPGEEPGENPPKKIEVLKIEDTVKDSVKEGLENWLKEKADSSATTEEITQDAELEMKDGETFEQTDIEPEEDKSEDKTDSAASFSAVLSGSAPSYTVSVDSSQAEPGSIFSISIVGGQGVIHGKSAQLAEGGNDISWGFDMFANTGDALLKVKRADTDEYQFINIPGYKDEDETGGEEDYEEQMDIDYLRIVEEEAQLGDKYYVFKYYEDDDLKRWQGACEIYYDSSKSQLYEKSYRIDGYMTGPYKIWHSNGQILVQGSYLLETGYYYEEKKDGQWLTYSSAGVLIKNETYSMGKRSGLYRQYASSGELVEESNYQDGQYHGMYKRWDEWTGNLEMEGSYVNGQKDGTWVYYSGYYPNGALSAKTVTEFQSGQVISVATTRYDEQGAVISVE
ncbi:Antitoxin component YwqK of the YwqJK toxin-antitoxin module [Peptoclostridium litorale DSM 5388]|uniref:SbsA Ig-like domain-containing protein n=1 Tax=Peptoclostridium litorale DSM 5388 TaxID=1121324 RepID=A0A069RL74_PEPLI|nr:Ig-like domain-containing protein [Peptoclostridium litorale]KDR94962.1 hypothetical protein CLIT_12c00300 [Peptoclostridium litorale DSM 5388]SIO33753.1 Antitoxin component YwqK of the YwqJK toxin-antitoxin module [Peptoclostridium litorale DSM 5388]